MSAVVAELFVYPIKSCGGVATDRAEIDAFGFRDDRRWMVIDAEGNFLSQRTVPRLATIRVRPEPGRLWLSAPGRDPLEVQTVPHGTVLERVTVWRHTVGALPVSEAADAWLGAHLDLPARLVWMPPATVRPAKRDPAGIEPRISFADAYPFLVVSRESLDALNERLDDPLPMDRFRPNLVIEGAGPFAEDEWTRFRIGGVEFDAGGPCARCATTTVDQATGEKGKEPLRTLATFRREGSEVMFGQNAIHRGPGEIRIGMPVEIVERRAKQS